MPRPRLRLLLMALAVGAVFLAFGTTLPRSPDALRDAVDGTGIVAPLVVLGLWIVLTPALVSGTLLAGATGIALGPAVGTPVAIAGAALGGIVAFLVAQRGSGGALDHIGGERLRRLQHRLEHHGFKAILCARMTPGVPSTLLNYAAGMSRIRLRDFAPANAIGGAPRVFAYTALGGAVTEPTSPLAFAGIAVLVVMTLAGAYFGWRTARAPVPAAT